MERRSRQKSGKYITVKKKIIFYFLCFYCIIYYNIIIIYLFYFNFIIVRRISKLRMEYKGYTVVMIACYTPFVAVETER